jgi:hypothetical protein
VSLSQAVPQDLESTAPLTEQERALVARIFSDPFSYPQSFKTWLVSFLEGSDMNLTTDAILGLQAYIKKTMAPASLASIFGAHAPSAKAPPGFLIAFAGPNPPAGGLVCDGRAVSRSAYPRLFAAVGTRWGAGNGSTTFNLPDLDHLHPPGSTRIHWLISF